MHKRAKDIHATNLQHTWYRIIQTSSDHLQKSIIGHIFNQFECFRGAGQKTPPASVIIMPATPWLIAASDNVSFCSIELEVICPKLDWTTLIQIWLGYNGICLQFGGNIEAKDRQLRREFNWVSLPHLVELGMSRSRPSQKKLVSL